MATLKFLDPRATVNPKDRPLEPGLDTLEGKIIGIIDNGQSNSTDMFKELGKLLLERLQVKEVGGGFEEVVAARFQVERHGPPDLWLVVDGEHPSLAHTTRASGRSDFGIATATNSRHMRALAETLYK